MATPNRRGPVQARIRDLAELHIRPERPVAVHAVLRPAGRRLVNLEVHSEAVLLQQIGEDMSCSDRPMNHRTTAELESEGTFRGLFVRAAGLAQLFPKCFDLLGESALRRAHHSGPGGVPDDAIHGVRVAPRVLVPSPLTEDRAIDPVKRHAIDNQGYGLLIKLAKG